MLDAKTMVARAGNLISLPGVALEVNRQLKEPLCSLKDVAAIIEADTALTAKILKLGNSVLLRNLDPVNTVEKAIGRIGSRRMLDLVMSIEVARSFDGIDSELISMEDFWRHSIYTALVAHAIAERCKSVEPGEAFTAGLLHDVGQLIMYSTVGEQVEECVARSRDPHETSPSHVIEQDVFDFDHTNVGLELALQWQLPRSLQESIYSHHQPEKLGHPSDLTMVVHMANSLAMQCETDSTDNPEAPAISDGAWSQLGIAPSQIGELIDIGKQQADSLLTAFISD